MTAVIWERSPQLGEMSTDPDLIPTEMQWVYQRYQLFLKDVYQKVLFPDRKGKKEMGAKGNGHEGNFGRILSVKNFVRSFSMQ